MNNLKQRTKLILIFILVGIIPIVIVSTASIFRATASMRAVQETLLSSKLEGDINSSKKY